MMMYTPGRGSRQSIPSQLKQMEYIKLLLFFNLRPYRKVTTLKANAEDATSQIEELGQAVETAENFADDVADAANDIFARTAEVVEGAAYDVQQVDNIEAGLDTSPLFSLT